MKISNDLKKIIVNDYKEGINGTRILANKYNINRYQVKKILEEFGVKIFNCGQRYIGGKSESNKKYYLKHKEKIKKYRKKWYLENYHNGNLKEKSYIYRKNNIEKLRIGRKNYEKEKSKDPTYRLTKYLRTSIWQTFKERNITYGGLISGLNYNINELKAHLEKQFKENMSWDNYGKWQLDHIIPISKFNYKSQLDIEFKMCWDLENLQPLWGGENCSKGNKFEDFSLYEKLYNKYH